jgi:hypothetical protein
VTDEHGTVYWQCPICKRFTRGRDREEAKALADEHERSHVRDEP